MKLFLISNMYPSQKDTLFGVFVKNFKVLMEASGIYFPAIAVIKGKRTGNLSKLTAYLVYYNTILIYYFFKKYDLIYVHFLSHNAPILALLLCYKKRPMAINVHGSDVMDSQGRKRDILNRIVLKKADLVVVPSAYFKTLMLQFYPFLTADRLFISPSAGINSEKFHPLSLAKNPVPVLGMVSRIDQGKGWDVFLKAMAMLKKRKVPFKAVIAGKGLEEKHLINTITAYNLNDTVNFIGLVNQAELINLYNSIDVLIFPTQKNESLGLVGLEAMSCNTPVIGSNIAGLKTYIHHQKNGFLFQPGNSEELCDTIQYYLKLPPDKKVDLQKAAGHTAAQYDSKQVIAQLHKRLLSLCIEN